MRYLSRGRSARRGKRGVMHNSRQRYGTAGDSYRGARSTSHYGRRSRRPVRYGARSARGGISRGHQNRVYISESSRSLTNPSSSTAAETSEQSGPQQSVTDGVRRLEKEAREMSISVPKAVPSSLKQPASRSSQLVTKGSEKGHQVRSTVARGAKATVPSPRKLCVSFRRYGTCRKGDKCPFSHAIAERLAAHGVAFDSPPSRRSEYHKPDVFLNANDES